MKLIDGLNGNVSIGGTLTTMTPNRIDPGILRDRLPHPHLPNHPRWEALYWRAWELGAHMVRAGTPSNGFAPRYVDAAFGGNIFQWDTCFIAAFARYSNELLPVLPALDNFYSRQEADGYMAREYRWENGAALWAKGSGDSCNPPLFAWAEWLVYSIHGDVTRLHTVWPHLDGYYRWLMANRRLPNGLYWITDMGSGMDNTPRYAAAWSDYTIQQALNARMMRQIAQVLGNVEGVQFYASQYQTLAEQINRLMWDDSAGFYWDLDASDLPVKAYTVAAFWALLAEIATSQQAQKLIAHLRNPQTFWRTHPFPTLAANERWFKPFGDYWLGGVWAPTNYMIIRGLHTYGAHDFAREATSRHLDAMCALMDTTGTIWENYRPDEMAPAIPARPDFVGWSGLGPIALLIESILGIELDRPNQTVRWLVPAEPGGVANLPWGENGLDLHCTEQQLTIRCASPLRLKITDGSHQRTIELDAGEHTLERTP